MKLKSWETIPVGLLVLATGVMIISEVRWARVNNPQGRFNNVSEYLAGDRPPSRVCRTQKEGAIYFIAHGPLDSWLALPSSPPAYVFSQHGDLIEWCLDPGDDSAFQGKWPLEAQKEITAEEFKGLVSP